MKKAILSMACVALALAAPRFAAAQGAACDPMNPMDGVCCDGEYFMSPDCVTMAPAVAPPADEPGAGNGMPAAIEAQAYSSCLGPAPQPLEIQAALAQFNDIAIEIDDSLYYALDALEGQVGAITNGGLIVNKGALSQEGLWLRIETFLKSGIDIDHHAYVDMLDLGDLFLPSAGVGRQKVGGSTAGDCRSSCPAAPAPQKLTNACICSAALAKMAEQQKALAKATSDLDAACGQLSEMDKNMARGGYIKAIGLPALGIGVIVAVKPAGPKALKASGALAAVFDNGNGSSPDLLGHVVDPAGGETPFQLDPADFGQIIDRLSDHWRSKKSGEINAALWDYSVEIQAARLIAAIDGKYGCLAGQEENDLAACPGESAFLAACGAARNDIAKEVCSDADAECAAELDAAGCP